MRETAYGIAKLVWSLIPVASRTVTVTTNSDKTGYTVSSSSPGTIKSIQRGTISLAVGVTQADAVITLVDMAKTAARWMGQTFSSTGATPIPTNAARIALNSTTAVRANRTNDLDSGSAANVTTVVGYEAEERN